MEEQSRLGIFGPYCGELRTIAEMGIYARFAETSYVERYESYTGLIF